MSKAIKVIGGVAAAIGVGYLIKTMMDKKQPSIDEKRKYLQSIDNGKSAQKFAIMNDQEINDSYDMIVNYYKAGKVLEKSNPLYARIAAISVKYNIFT